MVELLYWAVTLFLIWRIMSAYQEMQRSQEEIHEEVKRLLVIMTVEQNQDGVFAYSVKNGEFLAHGETFKQMVENFKFRFPGKRGVILGNNSMEEIE